MPQPNAAARDVAFLPDRGRDAFEQFLLWLRNDSLEAALAVAVAVLLFLALATLRRRGCRLLERGDEPAAWQSVAARVARRTKSFFLAALSADLVANFVSAPGD